MPYDFTLTAVIPATPQEIYDAWLDSRAHSEMTGGKAVISDEIDAEFSAWDDYITGRNLELVPGERIVQSWRTAEFTDAHDDSTITVTLEAVDGGTLVTLEHTNVPDDHTSYERGGWHEHYFEPMKAHFAKRGRGAKKAKAGKTTAGRAKPKAAVKPAAKVAKAAKGRSKPKAKAKPAASRKKPAPRSAKKAKPKHAAKAKRG